MEKDKKLYSINVNVNFDDYKRNIEVINNRKLWKRLLITAIIIIVLSFLLKENNSDISTLVTRDVIYIIIAYFVFKSFKKKAIKRDYNFSLANGNQLNYKIYFYEDFLEIKSDSMSNKIQYKDIVKFKDEDYSFSFFLDNAQVLIISKELCSAELITFICNNIINSATRSTTRFSEDSSKQLNPKVFLLLIFILTVATPWIGLSIWGIIVEYVNAPIQLSIKYGWTFIFVLPIPIISIILGHRYKKRGYKCKKNIIAGRIVSILLIINIIIAIFGLPAKQNYSKISNYSPIINVDLPSQGKMYFAKYTESPLSNHQSVFIIFTNDNEIKKFSQDISNNDNWITQENINSKIKILLTDVFIGDCNTYLSGNCKYSVYIENIKEYNTLPEETGTYHVYAMAYDYSKNFLDIEEYQYDYVD